jgi:uncharacterized protein YjbI with pentapeptide repeats
MTSAISRNIYLQTHSQVSFGRANLSNTDFSGSALSDVSFGGANLQSTNFCRTKLRDVDFTMADLEGANFEDALFCRVHMPDGSYQNEDCEQIEGVEP